MLSMTPVSLNASEPWKGTIISDTENIRLKFDLYNESIEVPGMEMFGKMNGYMNGNVYGVWSITSCEIKDSTHASIHLSNDLGSDTQVCNLTILNDSIYKLELKGGTVIKKVEKKKLVKIPSTLTMRKSKYL